MEADSWLDCWIQNKPVVKTLNATPDSTPKKLELVENPESTISRAPSNVPISYILGGGIHQILAPDLTHLPCGAGPRAYFSWERNMVKIKCNSFVKGISEYDRTAGWSSSVDVLCLLMTLHKPMVHQISPFRQRQSFQNN